jgi:hypothetical protein
MISLTKKQLRSQKTMLESLIAAHGGETTLFAAHDKTSVALDYYRGSCVRWRKKKEMVAPQADNDNL